MKDGLKLVLVTQLLAGQPDLASKFKCKQLNAQIAEIEPMNARSVASATLKDMVGLRTVKKYTVIDINYILSLFLRVAKEPLIF